MLAPGVAPRPVRHGAIRDGLVPLGDQGADRDAGVLGVHATTERRGSTTTPGKAEQVEAQQDQSARESEAG
jgi:hypothetical protein